MKSALQLNTEISARKTVALWNISPITQEIFWYLMNLNVCVDAFCMDGIRYDTLLGKRVLSVHELLEEESFALIVPVQEYQRVLEHYGPYGLKDEDLFVWIDAKGDFIYI